MKLITAALLFATGGIAAPSSDLNTRQTPSYISNDYFDGGCKPIVMLYAASPWNEPENLVRAQPSIHFMEPLITYTGPARLQP